MRVFNLEAKPSAWKLLLVGLSILAVFFAAIAVIEQGVDVLIWISAGIGFIIILIYPHIGLYVMLFLIPLENVIIFENGATLVKMVGLATGAAWVISKIVRRESFGQLFKARLAAPMLAFLFFVTLSVAWSDFNIWKRDFLTYLQLIAMVFITLDVINSPKRLNHAFLFLFLGCMVSAGIIIYNFINPLTTSYLWSRPRGGDGDPNDTATTFLTILPIVFWFMSRGKWRRWLFGGISAAILLLSIGMTVSRTGLAAIVFLVLSLLLMVRKERSRLLLAIVVLMLVVAPLMPWENISYRFTSRPYTDRIKLYVYALDVLRRYPFTGGGLDLQGLVTNSYVIHNLFLEIGAQLGLPGLCLMIWLCTTAWRNISAASRQEENISKIQTYTLVTAIRLSTLMFLFFSMTLSTNYHRMLWLLFALGEVCLNEVMKTRRGEVIKTGYSSSLALSAGR